MLPSKYHLSGLISSLLTSSVSLLTYLSGNSLMDEEAKCNLVLMFGI